jgi:TusA-related sulfurtransferase
MNFLQRGIRNYELDVQGYDGAPLKLYIMNALKKIRYGEVLNVIFDDPESHETVKMAVNYVGYRILDESAGGGVFKLRIKKV